MSRVYVFCLLVACTVQTVHATTNVLSDVLEIRKACLSPTHTNAAFSVEGHLLAYHYRPNDRIWTLTLACQGLTFELCSLHSEDYLPTRFALNDLLRLRGRLWPWRNQLLPRFEDAQLVKRQTPGAEIDILPSELFNPDKRGKLVRLTGLVRDAFCDESDPNYIYLTLLRDSISFHAMLATHNSCHVDARTFIGAEVSIQGQCLDAEESLHRHAGRILLVSGTENLRVIHPPGGVDDDVPDLASLRYRPPADFSQLGRHRVTGTVRAVWQGDAALLETDRGDIIQLRFRLDGIPVCGQRIAAIGFPETDLYYLSLVHADWTPQAGVSRPERPVVDISPRYLLENPDGRRQIRVLANGGVFRLHGTVRFLPEGPSNDARFYLESHGRLVAIDASAFPSVLDSLAVGCKVSATGVCVLDMESRNPVTGPSRARGFFLVLRRASDIVVLSSPSWWTPVRLFAVIGTLLAVILLILIWNLALRRCSERRGRELAEERLCRITSELKVEERTRLAVELHDALSQTLTGISMKIGVLQTFSKDMPPAFRRHLQFVTIAIDTCRRELKNCLWDLRSQALEEADFETALRRTLCQNLGPDRLALHLDIPRNRLTDHTMHILLQAIRELVTNSIRHGHAEHISITGKQENGRLSFSVRDDGSGFDPSAAPGIAEGHFGLQGIRERIARYGGELQIESAPGKGTQAVFWLNMPSIDANRKNQTS